MKKKLRKFSSLFYAMIFALVTIILGTAGAGDDDFLRPNSEQLTLNIDGYFQQAEAAIANIDIRQARQELSLIQFKIEKHKKQIPRDVRKTYEARLTALSSSVKQKVDSLVKVNLTVLKKDGQTKGIEFRQQLAIQRGLSEAELALVDDAIINTAPTKDVETGARKASPPEAPAVRVDQPQQQELPGPVPSEKPPSQPGGVQGAPYPSLNTLNVLPMPVPEGGENKQLLFDTSVASLPPQPQSSQRSDINTTGAVSTAAKVRALLDSGKADEAMTVFKIYQPNLRHFLDQPVFEQLKSSVEEAYAREQNQRSYASQQVQTIDDLIDQDRSPTPLKSSKQCGTD